MSPDPGSDRPLDADIVRSVLLEQFPEFAEATVAYLGEGYDHQMYEVADEWLFRFPKRAEVVPWSRREIAIMEVIAPAIGVPVPLFEKIGRASEAFPYPFVAYRRIPGVSIEDVDEFDAAEVAPSLGGALTRLHSIAPALIPPDPHDDEVDGDFEDHGIDVLASLPPSLRQDAAAFVHNGIPCPPFAGRARVVHSDLLPEHVLVDPATGRLTGIIDFADLCIGDPAGDFAGLAAMGGWDFVGQVMASYRLPLDEHFAQRVLWRTRRLQLGELVHAISAAEDVDEHVDLVVLAFAGSLSGSGA